MDLGAQLLRDAILNSLKVSELAGAGLSSSIRRGNRIGLLSPIWFFRFAGHDAYGSAAYIACFSSAGECLRLRPCILELGRKMRRSAFPRGETCQFLGGFHQLGRCAREGREGVWESGSTDLALCFVFPVAVSLEGQTTLSRRLLLMKTTRFLAGPFNNCAHPGIGAARDKSPDPCLPLSELEERETNHPTPCLPCLAARALVRRPLVTDPIAFIALRKAIGRLAPSPQLAAESSDGGSRLSPHSHPCLSLCTISVGKHWASVRATPPTALA